MKYQQQNVDSTKETRCVGVNFTNFSLFYHRWAASRDHQMAIYSLQKAIAMLNTIVRQIQCEYFPLGLNRIGAPTHASNIRAKCYENDSTTGIPRMPIRQRSANTSVNSIASPLSHTAAWPMEIQFSLKLYRSEIRQRESSKHNTS